MDEEIIKRASPASANLHIKTTPPCFIYRLPAETLEAIFIHCASNYHGEDTGYPTLAAPGWVNVSYVSSHWRNVALNCAVLWTYLFVTSRPWTEELLARSRQAPLKVKAYLHSQDTKLRAVCFVEQVMNHLERIQELHLRFSTSNLNYPLLSKLSSRAPCLQSLVVVSLVDRYGGWYPASVLLGGDTPALRTVELTNCPVPWHSLKLTGLTTLRLNSLSPLFQQNVAEFLTTLSCMQDLTHLYLEDALASASGFLSSAAFHTSRKINLPHLSHLLITAPLSTITALLSCVNIPLTTRINLNLNRSTEPHSSTFDDYTPFCSLLAQRLHTLSGPTIRRLIIVFMPNWEAARVTFAASERDFSVSRDPTHPLRIYIPFDRSTTTGDRGRIISHICCPVPLSNIQSICILNPQAPAAFWTHVLGHLRGLRCIELHQGNMPDLAAVLSLVPHDFTESHDVRADGGPNHIIAPALEELKLLSMSFSAMLTQRDHVYSVKVIDVQSLCDALATRKGPQGQLTMTHCTERNSEGKMETFDMVGWWEGGRFQVVDKHDSVRKFFGRMV
ncbi:hypothetical protein L210DRAFT_3546966 [Boletus edulis BED1]|uniref:F-box domain-containing protein n=1 Tax=Boletus edulis BED1 TaxID=1328754 RepID=A0AAD4BQE4_BOLED|nr:hypothetical protein L210DRAFT_3546966 [Boletus edulis BED1]